jgi:ATP-dependent DNA ligase
VSEFIEDGAGLLEAVKEMGLEGIMAKQRQSVYLIGKRSEAWLKIKTRQTTECLIIGYTEGKGDRQNTFGALHLAQRRGEELQYVGKVGTGFDEHLLEEVSDALQNLPRTRKPVREKTSDDARSIWLEPKLICEVGYGSLTPDGLLREPVFIRLRPDL